MQASQSGQDRYRAYEYEPAPEARIFHVAHGYVPRHKMDFLFRPSIPRGASRRGIQRYHFNRIQPLIRHLEPAAQAAYGLSLGNVSSSDVAHGRGALALMLSVRFSRLIDQGGRGDAAFSHGIIIPNQAWTFVELWPVLDSFTRRFLSVAPRWYARYHAAPRADRPGLVEEYLSRFEDLPNPVRPDYVPTYRQREVAPGPRLLISCPRRGDQEAVLRCAARIAAVLFNSDVAWADVHTGGQSALQDALGSRALTVRLAPEDALGTAAGDRVLALTSLSSDDEELAENLGLVGGAAQAVIVNDEPPEAPAGEFFSENYSIPFPLQGSAGMAGLLAEHRDDPQEQALDLELSQRFMRPPMAPQAVVAPAALAAAPSHVSAGASSTMDACTAAPLAAGSPDPAVVCSLVERDVSPTMLLVTGEPLAADAVGRVASAASAERSGQAALSSPRSATLAVSEAETQALSLPPKRRADPSPTRPSPVILRAPLPEAPRPAGGSDSRSRGGGDEGLGAPFVAAQEDDSLDYALTNLRPRDRDSRRAALWRKTVALCVVFSACAVVIVLRGTALQQMAIEGWRWLWRGERDSGATRARQRDFGASDSDQGGTGSGRPQSSPSPVNVTPFVPAASRRLDPLLGQRAGALPLSEPQRPQRKVAVRRPPIAVARQPGPSIVGKRPAKPSRVPEPGGLAPAHAPGGDLSPPEVLGAAEPRESVSAAPQEPSSPDLSSGPAVVVPSESRFDPFNPRCANRLSSEELEQIKSVNVEGQHRANRKPHWPEDLYLQRYRNVKQMMESLDEECKRHPPRRGSK